MHCKMDFDEKTHWAYECSIIFKKNVKFGQNLNYMYGWQGYQTKILWDGPLSSIATTAYFYYMILKIMCRYTNYLWIIKFSRADFFHFHFYVKIDLFSISLSANSM